jgi:hypothetical protein
MTPATKATKTTHPTTMRAISQGCRFDKFLGQVANSISNKREKKRKK